ncbi:YbfB/YjiJ family MFS transporter [Acinetobacter tandoii]|nr:YbfB/YjiJ family MFS transporter [Acinetobacter tandoii]
MNRTFSNTIKLSAFLCLSMCLGIGILRFSYTALLPSTREAYEWSHNFASILGSANLLGYLVGAYWAMKIPQNPKMPIYIISAAFVGSISLFACAFSSFSEIWYLIWRFISGISGGLLMILSPSVVAQCSDLQHRFKINFIGFSGIGLGVLCATLFMPYLDRITISTAWLILCAFAFGISALLWFLVRPFQAQLQAIPATQSQSDRVGFIYYSLLIAYACSAFAYIPHSLFWIDYLSHVLVLNLFWINFNWILYGLGSALGAYSAYVLARRLGNFATLKVLYSIYIFAVLIAVLSFSPIFTFISSFLTGLLNPAVVFLTSYTILQLYGLAYKKLWSMATLSFATIQLLGGISFSTLQHFGVSYHQQFSIASAVLLLGTLQLFWFTRPHAKTSQNSKQITD